MKSSTRLLRLLITVLIALVAAAASAQTDICMTGIGGLAGVPTIDGIVDGFSLGPPNSDPGWNGATRWSLSETGGVPIATKFQAGNAGGFLYLSWKIDTPQYGQDNTIVVGFANTGAPASTDWLIHIVPFNVMPAPMGANQVPVAISFWRNSTANAWRTDGPTPAAGTWLATNVKVSRTGNTWAVEMRVPVTANIGNAAATTGVYLPAAGTYRFYTNVLNTFGFVDPAVEQDPWPAGVDIPTGNTVQANTPDPTTWGTGSLNARAACTGVSLAWADIGVEKPANSGTIVQQIERFNGAIAEANIGQCNALADGGPSVGPDNVFIARPLNEQPTNADKVFATFRVANWGVPAPQEFDSIGPDGVTDNPTPQSGPFANGLKTNLRAHWALTYKQSCQYKFKPHQCIQVDLDSNDAATRFKNKSVQKNMDFVPLSRFERRSRISGAWTGPGPHTFLLTVRTDEQVTRGGIPPDSWNPPDDRQFTAAPLPRRSDPNFSNQELVDATSGMTGVAQLAWSVDALLLGAPADTLIINGRPYRSSTRVGGFGFVGSHTGPFERFASEFTGAPGTTLEELGPGVYRLTISDNDEAFVDTVLETIGDRGSGGRWRFFVDAGINDPDASTLDGAYSINAGVERILTSHWSVEGILGYHRFDGQFDGRPFDVDAWQLSANAKYFFLGGPLRPFVNGGVGLYRVDPPDDTEFGFNAGAGLLYEINSKWGVEGVYNVHSTDPLDWWTLQLGLRWHFK